MSEEEQVAHLLERWATSSPQGRDDIPAKVTAALPSKHRDDSCWFTGKSSNQPRRYGSRIPGRNSEFRIYLEYVSLTGCESNNPEKRAPVGRGSF